MTVFRIGIKGWYPRTVAVGPTVVHVGRGDENGAATTGFYSKGMPVMPRILISALSAIAFLIQAEPLLAQRVSSGTGWREIKRQPSADVPSKLPESTREIPMAGKSEPVVPQVPEIAGDKPNSIPVVKKMDNFRTDWEAVDAKSSDQEPEPAKVPEKRQVVTIEQDVPDVVQYDQPTPITIMVQNTSAEPVENVVVTRTTDKKVRILNSEPPADETDTVTTWDLGTLEPDEMRTIEFSVQPRPDAARYTLVNEAEVSFVTTSSVKTVSRIVKPKLIVKTKPIPHAKVGDKIPLSIYVANVGNANAENVIVRAPLPAGISHRYGPNLKNKLGTLKPGEERTINLVVTATQPGDFVERILLTADRMRPVEHTTKHRVDQMELVLTTIGPKIRYLNRPCTFEFTVTNTGTGAAKNTNLVTAMPKGVAFAYATEEGIHDEFGNTVHWGFGELGPGESKTVVLTGVATAVGEQNCQTVVTADGEIREESSWMTKVEGVAAVLLEVSDVDDPVEVQAETVYEIRIVNQGSRAATNIQLSAVIPYELEPIAADGPTMQSMVEDTLRFDPIDKLDAKAEVVYRVKVKAMKPGDHRFKVKLETGELSQPVVEEEATRVYQD